MSVFEKKFPYHALLFQEPQSYAYLKSIKIRTVSHLIVLGPLDKKTISIVQEAIILNSEMRVFWITNEGSRDDCLKEDQFFDHPYLYLFGIDEPESLALKMAPLTLDLHFEAVNFYDHNPESFTFLEKIKEHYVVLFYLFQEKKGYDEVFTQVFLNSHDTSSWFSIKDTKDIFKNEPLIIVGAGPSYDKVQDLLKEHQNSLNLISIGTATALLHDAGIVSDIACHVCPNFEARSRLHGKIKSPFIFTAPRCHHEIFQDLQGKKIVTPVISALGFKGLKDRLGPCPIVDNLPSNSTTSLAFACKAAEFLGFSPIILVGCDLAYKEKKYAAKIESSWEQERFIPEISAIKEIVENSGSKFYRVGEESLFQGLECLKLDEFAKLIDSFKKSDFEKLSKTLKKHKFSKLEYLNELKASFERIKEKWDFHFREVHIEDELGFQEFLKYSPDQEKGLLKALSLSS